jgi:glycosyltransferase involved in cell wall biosynthesis
MACGGIVVGTSETGMKEMLNDTCGFVVSSGDVSGLEKALASTLALPASERAQMKEAARQRIRKCFDHQVIVPQILRIYREAIALSNSRSTMGVMTP